MSTGLVVGKFTPFHLGHKYLIDTALEYCDRTVYVLPYSNPDLGLSQKQRIKQIFDHYIDEPRIWVLHTGQDVIPSNDVSALGHRWFCAVQVFKHVAMYNALGTGIQFPDYVFTSEDYGDGFAEYLSLVFNKEVKHICVDKERKMFPISGTKIRNGGYDEWKVA